ncbi:MAG: hypothetical protein LJE96_08495 [Deltaproteobacteria bacterium]|nr:hypothetical protein [Deltaproteobacteria bacterium]
MLAIKIEQKALENACKEIIESILICLPNAFKGTVYRVGILPEMVTTRITSGIIDENRQKISWGLPEVSDYNPPGKPWNEYRDEPGRPLEAMAWCVERQSSWTAEDPRNDARSVRLQVEGIWKDFHHMEPVLIRKKDLYLGEMRPMVYPENYAGETIWENSDYVVAAVIKIHFQPYSIRIGGNETKVIKRLSRALGTELLSYQLREQSLEAARALAEDRLHSCNILADSLRNVITKSGLIFSLIKLEMGFLRDQWERTLLEGKKEASLRQKAINSLNELLNKLEDVPGGDLTADLKQIQNRFLTLHPSPEQGRSWLKMKIEDKWSALISERKVDEKDAKMVMRHIEDLYRSLYLGENQELLAGYKQIPESLKSEWVNLLYKDTDVFNLHRMNRLIALLNEDHINLPHKEKTRESLIRLKAVAQIFGQLEEKTNVVLREVLNGHGSKRH